MSQSTDLIMLGRAVQSMTASLDMDKAMIETLACLQQYFPVDAISLHQYSDTLQALKLYFLVSDGKFDFVEKTVPISGFKIPYHRLYHTGMDSIILCNCNQKDDLATAHSRALSSFIENKERGYLVGMLQYKNKIIGHLCFMGTHTSCFTEEHKRMFSLLLAPFASALSNLLTHKRTVEFQKKLYAQVENLQTNLDLLKGKRLIGESSGLKQTMSMVQQLRDSELPVLILGETGTGKELIADSVQAISTRKDKPFVKVNCGAIPESLIDSELFGYEKGAFTGAITSRAGKFEQAHGGTIFLDEIGELPLQAQVRLLRVLQNNTITRIGGTKSIEVNVRIIAATNKSLEHMMQQGTFREDLYYRLYVFPLTLPPLRERKDDLPELIYYFAKRTYAEFSIHAQARITTQTLDKLLAYSWPGNIRELENCIKRAITIFGEGPLQLEQLLPQDEGWYLTKENEKDYLEQCIDKRVHAILKTHFGNEQFPVMQSYTSVANTILQNSQAILTLDEAQRQAITHALTASHGKIHGKGGAAELLNVNPNTLRSKMRKFGMLV